MTDIAPVAFKIGHRMKDGPEKTPASSGSNPADPLGWRAAMGSLIKKRRKRMRKKKHKKRLQATRWQRRAGR